MSRGSVIGTDDVAEVGRRGMKLCRSSSLTREQLAKILYPETFMN